MFDVFSRLFGHRQTEPPKHERGHVLAFPMRAESGVVVNEDAALSVSTAFACGSLIARSIAMLPAHVMAPRGSDEADGNERLRDHPVEVLLHRASNPEMTAFRFRESSLMAAIFYGNSYAEIERDGAGRPLALWPLHPDRVSVCRDPASGVLFYEVNNGNGERVPVASADIFHLAGPSITGSLGLSLISYARHSLGLALAQEQFAGSFIRNQAAPSGLLTVKCTLTPEGMERLRLEAEKLYSGPRRAGRIMFGDGDTEWTQIGVSPQDAEFLAQRRFAVEEIARWFGVPPQMVGDTSKQTFANFEQAGLNFLTLAVLPWVSRFEQETNRKLLSRSTPGRAQPFLKINTAAIVRADIEKQTRALAVGRQWGWLSVNDCRRLLDMEPIGPEGDIYLQPMNMDSPGADPANDVDEREQVAALIPFRRRG